MPKTALPEPASQGAPTDGGDDTQDEAPEVSQATQAEPVDWDSILSFARRGVPVLSQLAQIEAAITAQNQAENQQAQELEQNATSQTKEPPEAKTPDVPEKTEPKTEPKTNAKPATEATQPETQSYEGADQEGTQDQSESQGVPQTSVTQPLPGQSKIGSGVLQDFLDGKDIRDPNVPVAAETPPNLPPTTPGVPGGGLTPPAPVNAPVSQPAATTPIPQPVPDGTELNGNGAFNFKAWKQGNDVYARGIGTVFSNVGDKANTTPGTDAKGNDMPIDAKGLWVSLPTGRNPATYGSPLPTVPFGTKVELTNLDTGQKTIATVGDEGPTQGEKALVDMSPATSKALGGSGDPNNSDNMHIQIRILGGAHYVTSQQVDGDKVDPNEVLQSDLPVIQQMGTAIYGNPKQIDFNKVDELIPQLKSGAFRRYWNQLGNHTDALQNNGPSDDTGRYQAAPQGIRSIYNAIHARFQAAHPS